MRPYQEMWHVKDGVNRVKVRSVTQQRPHGLPPLTVYRDERGQTYKASQIKAWSDLSKSEKKRAYRDYFSLEYDDALFRVAKDPTLEIELPAWKRELKEKLQLALDAIDDGVDVVPPQALFEEQEE